MSFTSSSGSSATGRPYANHPMPGAKAQIWISPRHPTYAGFTNTSHHPVSYNHRVYETAENLYHAFKVLKLFTDTIHYSHVTPLQFIGHNDHIAERLAKAADPKKVADAYQELSNPSWKTMYASIVSMLAVQIHRLATYCYFPS